MILRSRLSLLFASLWCSLACTDAPATGTVPHDANSDTLWQIGFSGIGRVAVTGDFVYYAGRYHEVIAVNKASRQVAWRGTTPITAPLTLGFGVGVAGDVVVFADVYLYAFDKTTGVPRWVFTGGVGANPAQGAPVGNGDFVFAGSVNGNVFGVRAADGSEAWRASPFGPDFLVNDPVLVGDTLFVPFAARSPGLRGGVAALSAATGDVYWAVDLSSLVGPGVNARASSRVAVDDSSVFAGLEHGDIVALDRGTGAVRWFRPPVVPLAGDLRHVAVVGKILVVGSLDRHIEGLITEDGSLLWSHMTGLSSFSQPLAAFGGKVYAVVGALVEIEPTTGNYRLLLGGDLSTVELALYGTPAIDDRNVYVAGRQLWALRKK